MGDREGVRVDPEGGYGGASWRAYRTPRSRRSTRTSSVMARHRIDHRELVVSARNGPPFQPTLSLMSWRMKRQRELSAAPL